MAVVTTATFLAAYWIAMALPNEYGSYTTLLIEPQAVSGRLVESGVAESDLNERLHLMTAEILSRPRLSRVIADLGLFAGESSSMPRQDIIDLMREQVMVVPVLPELEQNLRTRREIEINTFRVEFKSTNH